LSDKEKLKYREMKNSRQYDHSPIGKSYLTNQGVVDDLSLIEGVTFGTLIKYRAKPLCFAISETSPLKKGRS